MTPPTAERLSELLLSDSDELVAQGEELLTALAGTALRARARLYTVAGAFIPAAATIQAAQLVLPGPPLRLLACDLAEHAVNLVESDVVPRPGQPARDPRCDEVISGVRRIAREQRPADELEALLPLALAADEHGWWETEAIYALLHRDPLQAFDDAARSLWILVHNIKRPPATAAPQAVRQGLLGLLA